MPEQAREHVSNEIPPMTVGQYLSPNYCPFEASTTDSAPNTQLLLPALTWLPINKILDSFF